MFFVVFTSIAIVRHRLLDIRLLVARSLAYLLLFTSIIGLYSLVVFVAATKIFGNNEFSERIVPIGAAFFLVFTIQPLRKFFDRVTNKFFYRDAYDSQIFLDNFNKLLVTTYELTPLLQRSAQIIEQNLKPTYTAFSIMKTETTPHRIVGTENHPSFGEDSNSLFKDIASFFGKGLVMTDLLEKQDEALKNLLSTNDIAVIVQLTSATNKQGIGYLMLGPKKSGNLYNSQDTQVIEIVANELAIAVQNALRFEEIENFNVTLQGRVDEATRKLRRANEKLKALDETKDDFISMASHQLRTPLTSIKGYISMVLEGDAGKVSHTQREMLDQAFFSSQRMVYLIADLLNISRLNTGKFVIESTKVNLAEMVEQELSQLQETAASHSLTLTYDKPKNFPDLMLDETKTRQVIMNFVDNAIYYTPVNGHITVDWSTSRVPSNSG